MHSTPLANPPATLSVADLEQVYDDLAQAIDQAGPGQSELFLVKLALLSARELGQASRFQALVACALQDLQDAG